MDDVTAVAEIHLRVAARETQNIGPADAVFDPHDRNSDLARIGFAVLRHAQQQQDFTAANRRRGIEYAADPKAGGRRPDHFRRDEGVGGMPGHGDGGVERFRWPPRFGRDQPDGRKTR